jgi:hypothetical protein
MFIQRFRLYLKSFGRRRPTNAPGLMLLDTGCGQALAAFTLCCQRVFAKGASARQQGCIFFTVHNGMPALAAMSADRLRLLSHAVPSLRRFFTCSSHKTSRI